MSNFCSECGSSLTKKSKFCSSCGASVISETPNSENIDIDYDLYGFLAVFPEDNYNSKNLTDQFEGAASNLLLEKVEAGDAESMLRLSLGLSLYEGYTGEAVKAAKSALNHAKKNKIKLDRYWFAYGRALQEDEQFDEAMDAYEKSINLGFGAAAVYMGQLSLSVNANLRNAIKYWKIGATKLNSKQCVSEMKRLEIDPGVYQAAVELEDGSYDVITIIDK
jgi:tetratricopeptide (TPR) repeat protein